MKSRRSTLRRVIRLLFQVMTVGFVALLISWFMSVFLGVCSLELKCWPTDSTGSVTPLQGTMTKTWSSLSIEVYGLPELTLPRFDWSVEKTVQVAFHHSKRNARFVIEANPYLLLSVTAMGPFLLFLVRFRKYDNRPRCACGYDLTGNVSGRCPECGNAVTAAFAHRRRDRARMRSGRRRRYIIATCIRVGALGLVIWWLVGAMRGIELADFEIAVKQPPNAAWVGGWEHRMNALLRASSLKFSYEGIGPLGTYNAKFDYSTRRRSFLGLAEYAEWDRADGSHCEVVLDSKVPIGCLAAAAACWLRTRRPYF